MRLQLVSFVGPVLEGREDVSMKPLPGRFTHPWILLASPNADYGQLRRRATPSITGKSRAGHPGRPSTRTSAPGVAGPLGCGEEGTDGDLGVGSRR